MSARRPEFTVADRVLRAVVAGACAWEAVALVTGRIPTVSRIAWRHPLFGDVVLTVLEKHFEPLVPKEV